MMPISTRLEDKERTVYTLYFDNNGKIIKIIEERGFAARTYLRNLRNAGEYISYDEILYNALTDICRKYPEIFERIIKKCTDQNDLRMLIKVTEDTKEKENSKYNGFISEICQKI